MKPYEPVQQSLKKYGISKDKVKLSNAYYSLLNFFDEERIVISNFQSMCLKNNPKKIRLRNDKFLNFATKKEAAIIIGAISYENTKKLFIFKSSFFYNYKQKTNSSNSIITFDFEKEFLNFFINDNIGTVYKKSKMNNQMIESFFYISDMDYLDNELFQEFNENSKDIHFNSKINCIVDPSIPSKFKDKMWQNHNSIIRCSNYEVDKSYCRCTISNPRKEDCNIHHLIPKEYFKKSLAHINWGDIHSPINLIPICYYCHKDIHSIHYFDEKFKHIIQNYKANKLYEEFLDFMAECTDLKNIDDLYNFYSKIN